MGQDQVRGGAGRGGRAGGAEPAGWPTDRRGWQWGGEPRPHRRAGGRAELSPSRHSSWRRWSVRLQGADDLEEALVHLVVLVLPRPVMAAVHVAAGLPMVEEHLVRGAMLAQGCVAGARAAGLTPPAS